MFDLFAEALQQVCRDGKAYENDVQIHIERLRGPGGRIVDDVLIWEGDEPRRDAADALGRIGDPAAVPELAIALRDEDQLLRMRAVGALAEVHAVEALPRLREALGKVGTRDPIGQAIAQAIKTLENRASLPRPADGTDPEAASLPRAARDPGPGTETLPRGVAGEE